MRINKFYSLFRLRLVLLCMTALFAVMFAVHITVYTTTRNMITDQFGLISQSTAVSVSRYIALDIPAYKQFLETRDVRSDYYRSMQEYLAAVKNAGNVSFIYTDRRLDDETVEFILDAEPAGSELYSPPGSTTFMDGAAKAVYSTGHPARLKPTVSEYGTLVGACAPIFGENGDILGTVGVNLNIAELGSYMDRLQTVMIAIYLIAALLVFILLQRYSGKILEPMIKDKLTGAYNKRYIDKLLQKEARVAVKHGSKLSLMMCDLDHFKNVNDTYGHAFGDIVLASVSQTIMGCLRKEDYFFRYGGEEFVALVAKADEEKMLGIAERIRSSVENSEIPNKDTGTDVRITISVGIAHLSSSAMSGEHLAGRDLIEKADKALYDAKKTRNAVAVFNGGSGA